MQALTLGLPAPTGLALLPMNFESASSVGNMRFHSEALTVRKLMAASGVALDPFLQGTEHAGYVHNKSADWIGPTLFVGASVFSGNESAISIALNVISDYVTRFFQRPSGVQVKLDVVVERKGDHVCKRISFEGDVNGLKDLPPIIKRIADE